MFDFQIVDEKYIYYIYRHDTVGVGLEGHALHRMNLDGSDIMLAAYEVSEASGMSRGHFHYKVVDGWIDCGEFKEAQDVIKKYSGTGVPKINKNGVSNIEFVSTEKVIGQYYKNGKWNDTKRVAIHHGKKASHIVSVEELND